MIGGVVRVRLGLIGLLALLLAVGADCAHADPDAVDAEVVRLTQDLGKPARANAVFAALEALDRDDPASALYLVAALERSGGVEATKGLDRLLRSRHARVRVAALESIARLGLRAPEILDRVRFATMDTEIDVVRATCAALGAIGDGRDVPTLLLLARSEDRQTRLAAFRGLRALSGVRIPHVYARWSWWWKTRYERAQQELPRAFEALETLAEDASPEQHYALVEREAWVLLPRVREQLRRWLTGESLQHRVFACRLAAKLKLTDLLDPIRPLVRFGFAVELKQAAAEAVEVLSGAPVTAPAPAAPTDR